MAVFNRKVKVVEKFEVRFDGSEDKFYVSLRKMSVPEILEFSAHGVEIQEEIKASESMLSKSTYMKVISALEGLIEDVFDLKDEEGHAINWSDLSESERMELLGMIHPDSAFELFAKAGAVGRLKEDEKKV